jgi:hypothetical protein
MPPRYAYWTILIDNTPTAFRAREQAELLPTIAQLRRTNSNVVMKWFARGRIWDSPEAERDAQRKPPAGDEKRGRDWRPGGAHRDPRDRFKKKKDGERPKTFGPPGESRPWRDKPAGTGRAVGPPRGDRPWQNKANRPPSGPPRGDRPWQNKANRPPAGPPRGDRPWTNKSDRPPSGPPRGDRPWTNKSDRPSSGPPRGDRPWMKSSKPPSGAPRGDKPWGGKPGQPHGKPQAPRTWGTKPQGSAQPWRNKPAGPPKGDRPWRNKPRDGRPFVPRNQRRPDKRRDDDPDEK